MANADKDVERQLLTNAVSGNVNYENHYGESIEFLQKHHKCWTEVCRKWAFGGNYVPRQPRIWDVSKHGMWSADLSANVH